LLLCCLAGAIKGQAAAIPSSIRTSIIWTEEGLEHPLLSRWAQYLAGRSDVDFIISPELKILVREGVPREYRQRVWRCLALALLVLQSEEDAFWCLVAVAEAIMPQDYYTKNLVASQADQRVLKDFMAEKLPRLASHFEDHNIDVSLVTFNWFLVVFVESLPSDILMPLWDAFLYEGTKVIFRYTLALFKYKEDDILKIHDSVEIYQYLRFFTKSVSNARKLTSIAFNDMNPFPSRLLRNRRVLHLERLQAELRELEEQHKEFITESVVRKDKELDVMVSEDDEDL
ncbi:TBC1 domain family member 2A-like, partial [Simochromis diagramma]|uniref:TBC1 domain family member 2A-like n=1 Tax=Simochromis diagramma TaxID=43689 RepID=UPI001A7EF49A